jgi:hypothetical protein
MKLKTKPNNIMKPMLALSNKSYLTSLILSKLMKANATGPALKTIASMSTIGLLMRTVSLAHAIAHSTLPCIF